jgi:hypothetical protein
VGNVGFDRPFGCRMVTRLDLAASEGGLPASNELLAFAMKGCFQAKLNGVVAQRSKDGICLYPHEFGRLRVFLIIADSEGGKLSTTDLSCRNGIERRRAN